MERGDGLGRRGSREPAEPPPPEIHSVTDDPARRRAPACGVWSVTVPEVNAFLTHLAVAGNVAASTQNQALASILFLWLAMLGAVVALRRDEHMRLTAVAMLLPPIWQARLRALAAVVVVLRKLRLQRDDDRPQSTT